MKKDSGNINIPFLIIHHIELCPCQTNSTLPLVIRKFVTNKGFKMKKSLAVLILLSIPILSFSQRTKLEKAIPGSVLNLNRGIYLTMDEFLSNEPSLPYNFEVHSYLANYGEQNEYALSYRDDIGYRVVLTAHEIWGYCDGESVFISYQGRPYELIHLGAISLLRFSQECPKSSLAQFVNHFVLMNSSENTLRAQDLLFHLGMDSAIVPTPKNIRRLMSGDSELYNDYCSDRKTDYFEKNLIFLQRYNDKYPVIISKSGIALTSTEQSDELVDKTFK